MGATPHLFPQALFLNENLFDTYLGLTDFMVKILKLHFECHSVCVVVQVVFNLTQLDFS